jgi:hypothetical protein
MPEEMTDDELIGPRSITGCVEGDDGSWECVLSCGHEVVFVVQPVTMELLACAQCIDVLLRRRDSAATDR